MIYIGVYMYLLIRFYKLRNVRNDESEYCPYQKTTAAFLNESFETSTLPFAFFTDFPRFEGFGIL